MSNKIDKLIDRGCMRCFDLGLVERRVVLIAELCQDQAGSIEDRGELGAFHFHLVFMASSQDPAGVDPASELILRELPSSLSQNQIVLLGLIC